MGFRKNRTVRLINVLLIGLTLSSCSESTQESPQKPEQSAQSETPVNRDINAEPATVDSRQDNTPPLTNVYLGLAQQQFKSTCLAANQLGQSTQQFLSSPSESGLAKVRSDWLTSHNLYSSTQLFRSISIKHPILDQSKTKPVEHSLAIRIDQTPLLPGYIDEVKGYPKSGYIFSTLPIDRDTLNKEHQFADSAYVALGFHAIEFVLWGENNRMVQEFSALPAGQNKSNDINSPDFFNSRRSQLLSLTTSILIEDLNILCNEWKVETGYYATTLKLLPTEEQIAAVNAATEQLISSIQIDMAKVRQANDDNMERIEVELHSAFSHSDNEDTLAKANILKSLIESKEWVEVSKKQEHTMKLTTLAQALLL